MHWTLTEAALSPWVSKMTSPFLNLRHLRNNKWLKDSMADCKLLQSSRCLAGLPSCRSCSAQHRISGSPCQLRLGAQVACDSRQCWEAGR